MMNSLGVAAPPVPLVGAALRLHGHWQSPSRLKAYVSLRRRCACLVGPVHGPNQELLGPACWPGVRSNRC